MTFQQFLLQSSIYKKKCGILKDPDEIDLYQFISEIYIKISIKLTRALKIFCNKFYCDLFL